MDNYGKIEIQILFLTKSINILHTHCLNNKKDLHSKRGLIIKISRRKKLLKYLKNNNFLEYNKIMNVLNFKQKKKKIN